jgi:hypothetical protein
VALDPGTLPRQRARLLLLLLPSTEHFLKKQAAFPRLPVCLSTQLGVVQNGVLNGRGSCISCIITGLTDDIFIHVYCQAHPINCAPFTEQCLGGPLLDLLMHRLYIGFIPCTFATVVNKALFLSP